MPGPARQPIEKAILKGTYNSTRYPDNMVEWATLEEIPQPPERLSDPGKWLWYKRCQELKNHGMLANSYLEPLERYCKWYDLWHQADKQLEKNGDYRNKHDQIAPEISLMEKAEKHMNKIEGQFGFNPSARSKIDIGDGSKDDGFDDL